MIEIAFDIHKNNQFKGKTYQLLDVPCLKGSSFEEYLNFARTYFETNTDCVYIIALEDNCLYDVNKLALSFFIQSCLIPNKAECFVFKVSDSKKAFENYKPYIAASIGIKYALKLAEENVQNIYKELKCLNYLNFQIQENYLNNTLTYKMTGNNLLKMIEANTVFEAIVFVSVLKILSLAGIKDNIELKVKVQRTEVVLDKAKLVNEILKQISSYIVI